MAKNPKRVAAPLSARTNRILGGVAPSAYLARLEQGWGDAPPIEVARLDDHLRSHLIDSSLLRADDFQAFIGARQEALLQLIEKAIGRGAYREGATNEPEEDAGGDDEPGEVLAAEVALHE